MMGKTHVTTGIAVSVITTQPSTVPELLCAIVGGAIGGEISDIDHNKKFPRQGLDDKENKGVLGGFLLALLAVLTVITIAYMSMNNISDIIQMFSSYYSVPLFILSGIIVVIGSRTSHRGFMHSFAAMFVLTAFLYFAFKPLAIPFFVAFLSHIVLDLVNKMGLQLFFPLKKRICFGWFPADGRANRIIAVLSTITAVTYITIIACNLTLYGGVSDISSFIMILQGRIKKFTFYIIIVNIITFLLYSYDYALYCELDKEDEYWYSFGLHVKHAIMDLLSLLGGVFGHLFIFIIYHIKLQKENAFYLSKITCLSGIWTGILMIIYDPFNWGLIAVDNLSIFDHLPLIIYIMFINIISFVIFVRDEQKRPKWSRSESILYILGMVGGTIGALFAIAITGQKEKSRHFANGFTYFLTAQVFIVIYVIHSGIA